MRKTLSASSSRSAACWSKIASAVAVEFWGSLEGGRRREAKSWARAVVWDGCWSGGTEERTRRVWVV